MTATYEIGAALGVAVFAAVAVAASGGIAVGPWPGLIAGHERISTELGWQARRAEQVIWPAPPRGGSDAGPHRLGMRTSLRKVCAVPLALKSGN